jgi:MTH538 TIR-like domain (DUF1863)
MKRSCVTVVLVGRETAINPWVRYQIHKSYQRGNAIIGIYVHNVRLFEEVEQEKGSLYFGAFEMGGESEGLTSRSLRRYTTGEMTTAPQNWRNGSRSHGSIRSQSPGGE